MLAENPPTPLLDALARIDLTSADGRAGIGRLLAEIERVSPGAITRRAATLNLQRLGCHVTDDGKGGRSILRQPDSAPAKRWPRR